MSEQRMAIVPGSGGATIGSLCTGYGGLDLAVGAVLNARTVWVSEFDKHAAQVAQVRFPGVPNLGDLTAVDWTDIEPPAVLTAGYPCQPFSHAGRRKGTEDDRHIWPHIARAIGVLRPRLVVLENVAGHLALGFDSVLGDLAELGFDAEWCLVRASDVGACHQRKRLFVVATDAEAQRRRSGRRPGTVEGAEVDGRSSIEPGRRCDALPADADGQGPEGPGHAEQRRRPVAGGDGSAPAADASGYRGRRDARSAPGPQEHPGWWRADEGDRAVAVREVALADPERHGRSRRHDARGGEGLGAPGREPARAHPAVAWGDYEPAIRRHERAVGRPAPSPVDERGRLAPVFVEWMMMLPAGWVTDLLRADVDPRPDHLSRAQALKILGNGVVPAQAAYAVGSLLERADRLEVAA